MHPTLQVAAGFAALRAKHGRVAGSVGVQILPTQSDITALDASIRSLDSEVDPGIVAADPNAPVALIVFNAKWVGFRAQWQGWFANHEGVPILSVSPTFASEFTEFTQQYNEYLREWNALGHKAAAQPQPLPTSPFFNSLGLGNGGLGASIGSVLTTAAWVAGIAAAGLIAIEVVPMLVARKAA